MGQATQIIKPQRCPEILSIFSLGCHVGRYLLDLKEEFKSPSLSVTTASTHLEEFYQTFITSELILSLGYEEKGKKSISVVESVFHFCNTASVAKYIFWKSY